MVLVNRAKLQTLGIELRPCDVDVWGQRAGPGYGVSLGAMRVWYRDGRVIYRLLEQAGTADLSAEVSYVQRVLQTLAALDLLSSGWPEA